MAVKIRLARRGRKKLAMYDVVVSQSRSPRDGVFIEKIGTYNPLTNPATINLSETKALDWLMKGAQPSDTVRAMLSYKGVLIRKHLQIGVIKGAITQEEADKRFEEWKAVKDRKINEKIDSISKAKEASEKQRMDRETKINENRAASLRQKQAARIKEEEANQKAKESPKVVESRPEAEVKQESEIPVSENKSTETEVKNEAPAQATENSIQEEPQASVQDENVPSGENTEDNAKASE